MASPRPSVVGLLLAAGRSSRFRAATGRDKLVETIPLGQPYAGIPVIAVTASALRGAVSDVVAVIDADSARATSLVEALGCLALRCKSGGMGESIAKGVAARPNAAGWLVMLADMPFVKSATIKAIMKAMTPGTIVAPTYRGQRGHPVGFGSNFGPALTSLTGDEGARAILATTPPTLIETDDPGVLRDIDSPDDWKKP